MKTIIIVGSGIAGLTATIKSTEYDANVILISPSPSEHSQSVMAMGGINAALNTKGQNDSTQQHFQDTVNSGCYLNNLKAVEMLTSNAPEIVMWLSSIGTSFTRDENGNVDVRCFGGQEKMRTVYAGSRTGKQVVTALTMLCRRREVEGCVTRYVGWRFLSLILTEDDECIGVIVLNEDTSEIRAFYGDGVIIATGGLNKVYGKTSGSVQNDGCATGRLFMQGIELADPEMVQFHPTTMDTSVKKMIITEAARGVGGRLYVLRDGKPWYFMEELYPEFGALMPRDVVSRSIYRVCKQLGQDCVYLDVTGLSDEIVEVKLDELYRMCLQYGSIDPKKEAIPVYPGVHYFMGGIRTDEKHRTNLKRVYAVGECSSQYHGANRLGGNSLLGAVHGGLIAAQEAVKLVDLSRTLSIYEQEKIGKLAVDEEIIKYEQWKMSDENKYLSYQVEDQIAYIMNNSMGIYRNKNDLEHALIELDAILESVDKISSRGNYYEYMRIPALVQVAKAMILGALHRKESRGAHQRIEYPNMDDKKYKKTTCVTMKDNKIKISFNDINLKYYRGVSNGKVINYNKKTR